MPIVKYNWQSFSKQPRKTIWLTDINAFDSVDDALFTGLEAHTNCTSHHYHRIVRSTFNSETLDFISQTPVYYLLKVSAENANA